MTIIYVLRLMGNKYYVGRTDNFEARMQQHAAGCASEWTTKYWPLEVVERVDNANTFDEDKYVKQYMAKYGINNVRGGSYITKNLTPEQFASVQREIRMATDACLKCGASGHYAKECSATKRMATLSPPMMSLMMHPMMPAAMPAAMPAVMPTSTTRMVAMPAAKTCYKCGMRGHYASTCYANKTPICYKCGIRGHYASTCYVSR